MMNEMSGTTAPLEYKTKIIHSLMGLCYNMVGGIC